MTSDAGVLRQESDDASHRHEVLNALRQMQPRPPLVTSPEARAALERARRQRPDRLGGFWVGHHRPQALAAAAWQAEPERLVRQGPTSLTSDGKVKGRVRTAHGPTVPGWGTSDRRKGQRRAGTRSAGVDAGLVRCGMHDCCTPAWAAAVSRWAALWGALEAAQDVLAPRGVALDTKTRRTLASRDATRARLGQQVAHPACADTVAGRREVLRSAGGRRRLRETPRGPKTHKGRRRSHRS